MDPAATRAVADHLRSVARQLGGRGGAAAGGVFAEVAVTLARADAAAEEVADLCDTLARGLGSVADGVEASDRSTGGGAAGGGAAGGGAAVVR